MSYKKLFAALPAAALFAMPGAHAAPAAPAQAATTSTATPAAGGAQQAMVVVRDAQTGELRAPTPQEMRALAPPSAGALRAPAQPAAVTHPGGSRQVRLGERGLVYTVVKRGPDGKLSEHCVQGAGAADKAVHAPQSASAPTTEHSHDHR